MTFQPIVLTYGGGQKLRQNDTVVLRLEPLNTILSLNLVLKADAAAFELTVFHAVAWSCKVYIEIHAVNTGARVVLDTEIDVLGDAETEVHMASLPSYFGGLQSAAVASNA